MSVCAKFQLSSWSISDWKLLFQVVGWVAGESGIKANLNLSLSWVVAELGNDVVLQLCWSCTQLLLETTFLGGWVAWWVRWVAGWLEFELSWSWVELRLSLAIILTFDIVLKDSLSGGFPAWRWTLVSIEGLLIRFEEVLILSWCGV